MGIPGQNGPLLPSFSTIETTEPPTSHLRPFNDPIIYPIITSQQSPIVCCTQSPIMDLAA